MLSSYVVIPKLNNINPNRAGLLDVARVLGADQQKSQWKNKKNLIVRKFIMKIRKSQEIWDLQHHFFIEKWTFKNSASITKKKHTKDTIKNWKGFLWFSPSGYQRAPFPFYVQKKFYNKKIRISKIILIVHYTIKVKFHSAIFWNKDIQRHSKCIPETRIILLDICSLYGKK